MNISTEYITLCLKDYLTRWPNKAGPGDQVEFIIGTKNNKVKVIQYGRSPKKPCHFKIFFPHFTMRLFLQRRDNNLTNSDKKVNQYTQIRRTPLKLFFLNQFFTACYKKIKRRSFTAYLRKFFKREIFIPYKYSQEPYFYLCYPWCIKNCIRLYKYYLEYQFLIPQAGMFTEDITNGIYTFYGNVEFAELLQKTKPNKFKLTFEDFIIGFGELWSKQSIFNYYHRIFFGNREIYCAKFKQTNKFYVQMNLQIDCVEYISSLELIFESILDLWRKLEFSKCWVHAHVAAAGGDNPESVVLRKVDLTSQSKYQFQENFFRNLIITFKYIITRYIRLQRLIESEQGHYKNFRIIGLSFKIGLYTKHLFRAAKFKRSKYKHPKYITTTTPEKNVIQTDDEEFIS